MITFRRRRCPLAVRLSGFGGRALWRVTRGRLVGWKIGRILCYVYGGKGRSFMGLFILLTILRTL